MLFGLRKYKFYMKKVPFSPINNAVLRLIKISSKKRTSLKVIVLNLFFKKLQNVRQKTYSQPYYFAQFVLWLHCLDICGAPSV